MGDIISCQIQINPIFWTAEISALQVIYQVEMSGDFAIIGFEQRGFTLEVIFIDIEGQGSVI